MSVDSVLESLSSPLADDAENLVVILSAGHGKRIKSETSKMLHEIWGTPTVERVYNACKKGLHKSNFVFVVGVKAERVAKAIGKRENAVFALQPSQDGTGHAMTIGLKKAKNAHAERTYALPGDMGLLDADTMREFEHAFISSNADMMALTGIYQGDTAENQYGRIIRAKETTQTGTKSAHANEVIEIKEYKDILALSDDYRVSFKGESFVYTKEELLGTREFNTGVYAFKTPLLLAYIDSLSANNAQNEYYLTDLIAMFNAHGACVRAIPVRDQDVALGFNNKSVLKVMNAIARKKVYERLKDIITIDDPDDFYIAEDVIDEILALDKKGLPLDIHIGQGAHIGANVSVNYGLHVHKNATILGEVIFGKNVHVYRNALISCFDDQTITIGNNALIHSGNSLKGMVTIGDNAVLESVVNITGSDEYPSVIGKNALIKGTTYLFGVKVDDDVTIAHSVITQKHVRAIRRENGDIARVAYVLPEPEGLDALEEYRRP